MKTRFQARVENMKRRYYEVFGDLEAQVEFLKLTSLLLLALLFFTLFGAFMLAKRPPVVIRVDEVGRAEAIQDLDLNNAPTEHEIFDFSKNFTKRFRELNSYTLANDTAEAWNRMTSRYRKIADRDLVESGFFSRFNNTGLYTRIEFKEESIDRDAPEFVRVAIIGVRNILHYNDPDYKESSLFKAELLLKKVPRSREIPWGLLVEDYREILLNKL